MDPLCLSLFWMGQINKNCLNIAYQKHPYGISLVVQWLRLHLSMQGVWVQSLVRELRSHMTHGQKLKTNSIKTFQKIRVKKSKNPYSTLILDFTTYGPNFFLVFSVFLSHMVCLWVFSNCCRPPKCFLMYLLKKNPHVSGSVQFEPVLFKSQLYT